MVAPFFVEPRSRAGYRHHPRGAPITVSPDSTENSRFDSKRKGFLMPDHENRRRKGASLFAALAMGVMISAALAQSASALNVDRAVRLGRHFAQADIKPAVAPSPANPPASPSPASSTPSGTPAPATPAPQQPAAKAPTTETPAVVMNGQQVVSVLGKKVRGADGADMGRIVDIVADKSGQLRAAIIDFGGFLGVGSRQIAVDWNAIRFPPDGKTDFVEVDLTRDQLRVAPVYKPGEQIVVLGQPKSTVGVRAPQAGVGGADPAKIPPSK